MSHWPLRIGRPAFWNVVVATAWLPPRTQPGLRIQLSSRVIAALISGELNFTLWLIQSS